MSSTPAPPDTPSLNINTGEAALALVEAKHGVMAVLDWLRPSSDEVLARHARLDAQVAALSKAAPREATQGAIRNSAVAIIEREDARELARRYDAAEAAVTHATALTAANLAQLDAVPDFVPPFTAQTRSGAEHQLDALRAELRFDRVRSELREYSTAELIATHRDAHVTQDWLTAAAAEAELKRAIRVGPNRRGLADSPNAILEARAAISRALDAAKAQRKARVSDALRQQLNTDMAIANGIAGQLREQRLFVTEVRTADRLPLPARR